MAVLAPFAPVLQTPLVWFGRLSLARMLGLDTFKYGIWKHFESNLPAIPAAVALRRRVQ